MNYLRGKHQISLICMYLVVSVMFIIMRRIFWKNLMQNLMKGFSWVILWLDKLIEFSRAKGLSSIALEVRVSNLAAISLYEGLGFEIAGKRLRFYRTPPEDAYVMIKQL
ncbi:MAG: GNAT family N-acetyltransferase [Clostridia bacterium]|nr:GNAT family N-acetyltransferase [Clostridia bacterium]